MNERNLGERIREELIRRNMTQKELADRISIEESRLSRFMNGSRKPSPDIIANIATVLKVTSDYLLGVEIDEFNFLGVKRLLAREADRLTLSQKQELIAALFEEG